MQPQGGRALERAAYIFTKSFAPLNLAVRSLRGNRPYGAGRDLRARAAPSASDSCNLLKVVQGYDASKLRYSKEFVKYENFSKIQQHF